MKNAIRWILTAIILYFVYFETGPFTFLTIVLITFSVEASVVVSDRMFELQKEIIQKMEEFSNERR